MSIVTRNVKMSQYETTNKPKFHLTKFRYSGTSITEQHCIYGEYKRQINLGTDRHRSVEIILCIPILKRILILIQLRFYLLFCTAIQHSPLHLERNLV